MSRYRLPASTLALSVMLLTGCTAPAPVLVKPNVPPTLLECQAQPPRPDDNDTNLAYWILDLSNAGQDCRDKLDRVKTLLQQ